MKFEYQKGYCIVSIEPTDKISTEPLAFGINGKVLEVGYKIEILGNLKKAIRASANSHFEFCGVCDGYILLKPSWVQFEQVSLFEKQIFYYAFLIKSPTELIVPTSPHNGYTLDIRLPFKLVPLEFFKLFHQCDLVLSRTYLSRNESNCIAAIRAWRNVTFKGKCLFDETDAKEILNHLVDKGILKEINLFGQIYYERLHNDRMAVKE